MTSSLSQSSRNPLDLTPSASLDFSAMSCSNTSLVRSQDFDVKESPVRKLKGPCKIDDQKSSQFLNDSNEQLDSVSRSGFSMDTPSSIERYLEVTIIILY